MIRFERHRHHCRTGTEPQAPLVVVGVDDSPAGRAAVDRAAAEAELRRWDLWLLHVEPPGVARYPADHHGARLIERMTDRVHACAPTVPVSGHLAVGAAATELLAELSDTDMVVVGHRGVPTGTAFGLRVGERVAARHRGPALIVPPPSPDPISRPVVVGIDDPSASAPALGFAHREAKLRGCDLVVLHATPNAPEPRDQDDTQNGVRVHHRAVAGDPAEALLVASRAATALVVRRHSSADATSVSSTARALVRDAACPVFLVG